MHRSYLVGVDLGGTNVRCGLVDAQQIIRKSSAKITSAGSEEQVVQEIIHCIGQVLVPGVSGIGIGVPAIVNTQEGIVYDVQNIPSWKEVHLKEILEKHFSLPVLLNNDANCFAVGEKHYGQAADYEHVVGLILGTGVAAGILCNGSLYQGRNCGAGEFGMLPYLDHNYEFYCSGNYFTYFHNISGEKIFARALTGDQDALQVFGEYGKHVSAVIRAVLYALDPDIIVLGGSVSKAFPFFKDSLWTGLHDFPYKPVLKNVVIKASGKENIAILGAAGLHLMSCDKSFFGHAGIPKSD